MARGMFLGQVIGNLTRDTESRALPDGTQVVSFTVAANTDKNGEATFVRVSAFGKTGEVASQYLRKGSGVFIAGKVSLRSYTSKDGEAKSSLELKADLLQLLDKKGENEGGQSFDTGAPRQAAPARSTARQVAPQFGLDDELPF